MVAYLDIQLQQIKVSLFILEHLKQKRTQCLYELEEKNDPILSKSKLNWRSEPHSCIGTGQ